MIDNKYDIHNGSANERLVELRRYVAGQSTDSTPELGYTNNHIHTFYSFSPYSPCEAVYQAKLAGLNSAGIVDHDTMAGAREFLVAGEILNIATTVGVECRVDMTHTALTGYRLNSPDQNSMAYMVMHAVPHKQIETVNDFFAPYRAQRNLRNFEMVKRINQAIGCRLDFEKDILASSKHQEGGSVTERHLMFALANWLTANYKKGNQLVDYLENEMALKLPNNLRQRLLDTANQFYNYDLLGVLKSAFLPSIYLPATDELVKVKTIIDFAHDIDAILAYAYLGDVEQSVTGDKPKQTFEDAYLPLLFETLRNLGIKALSYMPSRNSLKQLKLIQEFCRSFGMLEISGEDVNSPRQSFVCEHLKSAEFKHLADSTWHLIEHERK